MRVRFTVSLAAVLTLGLLTPALAQQPDADKALTEAAAGLAVSVKRQAQRDPLIRSGLSLPEPQLTFETTRGQGRATGAIGLVKQGTSGETSFGLAISSPIGNSDDAEARPLDLRGLGDGATVSFSISGSSLFKTFSVDDVRKLCADSGVAKVDCTAGKLEDANPDLSQQLLNLVFKSVPILYGGSFTYGRNTFSFFDATGTKQEPISQNDMQAEFSLGFLVNGRRDLFAFHAGYSDVYTASPNETQLCRPLTTGATVSRCDVATLGGPTHERSLITTVEYRWQKRGNSKYPLAFAPKFQFAAGLDDTDNVTSFEAPFYIFQEKPKDTMAAPKLNGGVSAGWRSDSGFQAGVFIGTTFSLFKM